MAKILFRDPLEHWEERAKKTNRLQENQYSKKESKYLKNGPDFMGSKLVMAGPQGAHLSVQLSRPKVLPGDKTSRSRGKDQKAAHSDSSTHSVL